MGQQKFLTQGTVALRVRSPFRCIPTVLKQRIEGFRNGFAQSLIEGKVKRADVAIVVV